MKKITHSNNTNDQSSLGFQVGHWNVQTTDKTWWIIYVVTKNKLKKEQNELHINYDNKLW